MRINVGCGETPTKGWRNFDNSLSLRISKIAFLPEVLYKLKFVEEPQYKFILFCRSHQIEYGDVIKGLPIAASAIEVLYASHLIEHFDRIDASKFLKESRRLLYPGGIIRLVTPDLSRLIEDHIKTKDTDRFILDTHLCLPKPRTIVQRIKAIIIGDREHRWMYTGEYGRLPGP